MASFDAAHTHLVVDTDHYPHFLVHTNGNDPRGFAFATDATKNPAFFALAAVAKYTGKKLRVHFTTSIPGPNGGPAIQGVTKVDILD